MTSARNRIILNARRESTVIMENEERSFTFDAAGRLVGAFEDGANYRRSLGNDVLQKRAGPRPGLSGRRRRMLDRAEVKALEERAYAFAAGVATSLPLDQPDFSPLRGEQQALACILSYSYDRLEREREEYGRIYRPVTILPPDQYLAVYLQATEGCTFNKCEFCGFYRDRKFRIKSSEEFAKHIGAVRSFLGAGLSLRRSIFLGDANALTIPLPSLVEMLDVINREFAILPRDLDPSDRITWETAHPLHFNGIYSFVDAFSNRRLTPEDYGELAKRGLRRVYVGLESGDAELLRFLGKPNTPAEVVERVQDLKAGGIAVGVIALVGAGGKCYREAHVRETARVINEMSLDDGDLVYFSEMVDYPGSDYARLSAQAGIEPLAPDEIEEQTAAMRAGLAFRDPACRPTVSYYDIREFIY